jgi:hypothetical protein
MGSGILNNSQAAVIDISGNVWVSNYGGPNNTVLVEIVGAAVPVVNPLSAGVANATVGKEP